MSMSHISLLPGDPAPSFNARSDLNPNYNFDIAAGRNIVMTFLSGKAPCKKAAERLATAPLFNDLFACLFLVSTHKAHEKPGMLPLRIPGVRAFFDDEKEICKLFGIDRFTDFPVSFIISQRLQILAIVTGRPDTHETHVLKILEKLPSANRLPLMLSHAPVLIIPRIFEPDFCKELIEGYHNYGGEMSGFMRDVNGKTVLMHDLNHKVRRDWLIDDSHVELRDRIQSRFNRRVIPEIKKAFQFDATRMERYLVSCYKAEEGGHFRPHRDNTTKGTAHRCFAISLNLNTEEYEGGDLRFPEFGDQKYRPPSGGCCVFSCSLLHEATPVTKGERFAFLPFLYDEAARKKRDENLQFLALEENK